MSKIGALIRFFFLDSFVTLDQDGFSRVDALIAVRRA
jgi:hypothetical protein